MLSPSVRNSHLKAAKCEIQKSSTCRATFFGRCFPFFTLRDQLVAQQNICCGLKKVVAKSRARVYFEQQILAFLLVFHQTHHLSRSKVAHVGRQVEDFCISCFATFYHLYKPEKPKQPIVKLPDKALIDDRRDAIGFAQGKVQQRYM